MASGGVDAVQVSDGGSGYTMPTVDFDLPDDPNGHQARGHVDPADLDANGTVTKVIVDDPGSGYSTAPHVVIHNGTLMDPIAGATEATATSTLELVGLTVGNNGSGYTDAPTVTVTDPPAAPAPAPPRARRPTSARSTRSPSTPRAPATSRRG